METSLYRDSLQLQVQYRTFRRITCMTYESPAAEAVAGEVSIPAAMEAFSNLADLWELTTDDQIRLLGSPGRSTFFKWKKSGGNLPKDTVERISHLLGIFKALQILIPDEAQADGWIRRPQQVLQKPNSAGRHARWTVLQHLSSKAVSRCPTRWLTPQSCR